MMAAIAGKIFISGILIFLFGTIIAQINGDIKANHKWIGMIGALGIVLTFIGALGIIGSVL